MIKYVLDTVGNRLARNSAVPALPSTTNAFNGGDRLDTDQCDGNGNTLAADGKTFSYDFRDKLKSVNGGAITLAYDGDGQRVRKTVGGVTTNYLVDELNPTGYAQVVEEIVGGPVQRAYTYGTMLISQRQLVGGNYVASHYGYDGSENVRFLTDAAGAVTDTFDYDAYGNLIGRTGTTANSYLYRGQQFDADLGFYYNRARYYSQQRGRFFTGDVFEGITGSPRSLHKYLYASADPINRSDPSGWLDAGEKGLLGALLIGGSVAAVRGLGIAISCTINLGGIVILKALGIDRSTCSATGANSGAGTGTGTVSLRKSGVTKSTRSPLSARRRDASRLFILSSPATHKFSSCCGGL